MTFRIVLWVLYLAFAAIITLTVVLPPIVSASAIRQMKESIPPGEAGKDFVMGHQLHIGPLSIEVNPHIAAAWIALVGLALVAIALFFTLHVRVA